MHLPVSIKIIIRSVARVRRFAKTFCFRFMYNNAYHSLSFKGLECSSDSSNCKPPALTGHMQCIMFIKRLVEVQEFEQFSDETYGCSVLVSQVEQADCLYLTKHAEMCLVCCERNFLNLLCRRPDCSLSLAYPPNTCRWTGNLVLACNAEIFRTIFKWPLTSWAPHEWYFAACCTYDHYYRLIGFLVFLSSSEVHLRIYVHLS